MKAASFEHDPDAEPSAALTAIDREKQAIPFTGDNDPTLALTVPFAAGAVFKVSGALSFARPGPMSLFVGDRLVNPASGAGTGAVTYDSTDPSVATVDARGQVTILAPGIVVIRAEKAADAAHPAARASYTLKSSEARAVASLTINSSTFSGRYGCQAVVFKNQLWLIAGYDGHRKNDVWSSRDGVTWIQQTACAAFSGRFGHQVVVHDDRLWLIGGLDDSDFRNDVWSSSDGATWIRETAHAAFSPRRGHQVVVHDHQLWLIGGFDGRRTRDVWSSEDGVTWRQRTASAAFSAREYHQVIVHDERLWLIGGFDSCSFRNDVWSSRDGIIWTPETQGAAFSGRGGHRVVLYRNELWLIGGFDGSRKNDVWTSRDGVNWIEKAAHAAFPVREFHQAVVYENRMLLIGGNADDSFLNDVWASTDGVNWQLGMRPTFHFRSR